MVSEARKRANEKYRKKSQKAIVVNFFPEDHKLYEAVQNKGKNYIKYVKCENGEIKEKKGMSEYIRDLMRKDLGMLDELKASEIDGE